MAKYYEVCVAVGEQKTVVRIDTNINKYIETYKDAVNFVMENIQHTYPHDNIEFEFVEEHPILDEPKIDKHIFMVETKGERERLQ